METVRLFDQDVDLLRFSAQVLDCQPAGEHWAVVLDQTAFFPEGGGQGADHGSLGDVCVLDVHEKQGVITHTVDAPLSAGDTVTGTIDAARRLDMMQQHSGEHILSGLICRTYQCSNVGFHIGEEEVRVDFSAPLNAEQLADIERRANEMIWRNVPIHAWYPDAEELAALDYRSKKELSGAVRIVDIPECDTCACCGTHVHSAGQVGQIKIVDWLNYKGGVRLYICCGGRALRYSNQLQAQGKRVSQLLSAKPMEIANGVERVLAERDELRLQVEKLSMQVFNAQAAQETGSIRVIFTDALQPAQLRKAVGEAAKDCTLAAVLLSREGGWHYAVSSLSVDVRPIAKKLNETFSGKGGGPKDMVHGMLGNGTQEEIRSLLNSIEKEA